MIVNYPYCTPLKNEAAWCGGFVSVRAVSTDTENWIGVVARVDRFSARHSAVGFDS